MAKDNRYIRCDLISAFIEGAVSREDERNKILSYIDRVPENKEQKAFFSDRTSDELLYDIEAALTYLIMAKSMHVLRKDEAEYMDLLKRCRSYIKETMKDGTGR